MYTGLVGMKTTLGRLNGSWALVRGQVLGELRVAPIVRTTEHRRVAMQISEYRGCAKLIHVHIHGPFTARGVNTQDFDHTKPYELWVFVNAGSHIFLK